MGLPNIFYPPPGDDGWKEFWFFHFQDHLEIMQKIQKFKNVKLTEYPIAPWMNEGKDVILELHQQYHNDLNEQLGLNGNDLSSLNFEKQGEVRSWVYLNYEEHYNARRKLGI